VSGSEKTSKLHLFYLFIYYLCPVAKTEIRVPSMQYRSSDHHPNVRTLGYEDDTYCVCTVVIVAVRILY
jgi:hypothetical protein